MVVPQRAVDHFVNRHYRPRGWGHDMRRRWHPVRPYVGGDDERVPPQYDLPIRPTVRNHRLKPLNESGWTYGGLLAAHHQGLRTVAFLQGWSAHDHPGPPDPAEDDEARQALAHRAELMASAALLRKVAADFLVRWADDDTAAITRPDTEEAS